MSKNKPKFYVVWKGVQPGIYTSWDEASRMVTGYTGAKFKSFSSRAEAETAYRGSWSNFIAKPALNAPRPYSPAPDQSAVDRTGIAVDAACSGVPGPMEYRGVWLENGAQLFLEGPYLDGTNNIGEFLAIVHAAAMLKRLGHLSIPIYSDSRNAIGWVEQKVCRTKLQPTSLNAPIFELITRALVWLRKNDITNPILKWETGSWGENPADFGRK